LSVARDGSLGLADQLGEASLAVDQRQVAQVAAVMLNQVGGEQYRGSATARNTGVCRLSDDPVVADVKREAAPEQCCGGRASPCF
jgi:anti-sigma-K factor RskA